MVAPGPLGEIGRDGQDLGARPAPGSGTAPGSAGRSRPTGRREPRRRRRQTGSARRDPRRLGVDRPVVDGHVEEVDLAVGRGDRAGRADQDARVVRACRSSDVSATLPTRIQASCRRATSANASVIRARDRSGRRAEAVVGAAELEVFGQGDQPGTGGRGGLGREARAPRRRWRRRHRSRRAGPGRRAGAWAHRTRRARAIFAVSRPRRRPVMSPSRAALAGLSLHWPGGQQSDAERLRLARLLRLPAVPLLLAPAGVSLADPLPATGPRRLALGPDPLAVDRMHIDLVVAACSPTTVTCLPTYGLSGWSSP